MNGEAKIAAFWEWFADNGADVEAFYTAGALDWLDANLTPRVQRMHEALNWEIGPYHHPENTLVISPGIRDNLALAEHIVAAAPPTPGWHFLPAKPPKELKRLAMGLPHVAGAEICADGWSYRLTAYNQMEFFDIDVFADAAALVGDKDLVLLTRRLIEALVGERLYLERFAAVKVHRSGERLPQEKITAFRLLGKHVAHLLKGKR